MRRSLLAIVAIMAALGACQPAYAITTPVVTLTRNDSPTVRFDDGARAITVMVPGMAELISVVVPGPQGPKGDKGDTGPVPTLTWNGDQLAVDGISGPHLTGLTGATGPTGADGVPGADGAPGPAGPQGPAGADGAAGPPNVLSIGTVATGLPGSSADATITGTSPAQILSLIIPRGDTGSNGTTPQACVDYWDGKDGLDGATGPAGPANELAVGIVTTLAPGSSATVDITGTSPNQVINFGIPQGIQGDPGALSRALIVAKISEASDGTIYIRPLSNSPSVAGLVIQDPDGNASIIMRNGSFEFQDAAGVLLMKVDRATRTRTMYYSNGAPGESWSPTTGLVLQ